MIFLRERTNREKFILRLLRFMGIVSFIAAAVLITIVFLLQIDSVQAKYEQYLLILQDFEYKVAALQNKWLIMIVIFLLYLLRSLSMMYPYTIIYIIAAMVFPPMQSFAINITGMAFTYAFRYYTGIEMGEGYLNKVLQRFPSINSAFEEDGRGNPIVLLALRLVPFFPLNTISQLYGTFEYPFMRYMLISLAATVPRLISYSFIGNNVYDPLSVQFFVPLIVLLIFTGISLFFLRGVIGLTSKFAKKEKTSERK